MPKDLEPNRPAAYKPRRARPTAPVRSAGPVGDRRGAGGQGGRGCGLVGWRLVA
jgi:hypothetical protein